MRQRLTIMVVALALVVCSVVLFAQAPPAPPKPGAEVQKMGILVGKFTEKGEMKADAMGPGMPGGKVTGTDDCKWVSGGFGVLCNSTFAMGAMKGTAVGLTMYDPSSKTYHYYEVSSDGDVVTAAGTVSGDTWTWTGTGTTMGKPMHNRYTMKVKSKDSWDYKVEGGESENSMKTIMEGTTTRVSAAAKAAASK